MAVNNLIHVNESGLPLNAIEWLERHHLSKATEREQMIRDIQLKRGSYVVDAGCGPGLWMPLLARATGLQGRILGVDISAESLVTANRRSHGKWYQRLVQYKRSTLEQLPVPPGTVDIIFSANVSQYLPDPVSTFAAMGRYLVPGGRLVIKDIDFGTMRFHNIDQGLQTRVFEARECWEQLRTFAGFAFEKSYRIVRQYPLSKDFRFYLQGIAEWFVSEGAPLLDEEDITNWLQCFLDDEQCLLDQDTFVSEETEFVVTGVWNRPNPAPVSYFDMHIVALEEVLA